MKTYSPNKRIKIKLSAISLSLLLPTSTATALTVADRPLFLGNAGTKNSNVFFVLDDSRSMNWSVLRSKGARAMEGGSIDDTNSPKSIDFNPGESDDYGRRTLCYGYNVMAYNPNVVYTPWEGVNEEGNPYPPADIYHLHIKTSDSSPYYSTEETKSAINDAYIPWHDLDNDGEYDEGECLTGVDFRPRDKSQCRNQDTWCQVVKDLDSEAQQNYANWREYYFRRHLTMKRALSSVVNNLEANAGMDTINRNNNDTTLITDMRINSNKAALMEAIFKVNPNGSTPLRRALKEAGKYFTEATEPHEIAPTPITEQAGQCQGNYAILFTDGFWNGGSPNKKGFNAEQDNTPVGNEDGDDNTDFDGAAYADSYDETLADVAMKYYEMDLMPSLPNNGFITEGVDENPAQHMVTYTISFGVNGTLDVSPAFGDTSFTWPQPVKDTVTTIDDLRHAAYNGRGQYLSANDPASLVASFQNIMLDIAQRDASAASFSSNTRDIQVNTSLFQSTLNSRYWSGDVQSFPLIIQDGNGILDTNNPNWKASEQLPGDMQRIIITSTGTGASTQGKPFRWNDLSSSQQTALGDEDVLNYLRGDDTHEQAQNGDQKFRDRPLSKLGDFVNSEPVYFAGTVPHIFVGSNDGMLHAFNAATGVETFAYIPNTVYPHLKDLSDIAYSHRFYVDGTVSIAATDSNTVLVGGLNAGGKSIYALNVSDMSAGFATESSAANKVLWEFTDVDLGLTYSRPQVIQLNNGTWAAVFGNGYNSSSESSILYIVNANTGALINKINAGTGEGLSTVKPFDTDDDGDIDFIYAGDLSGQLWKFDVTGNSVGSWHANLLFTASSGQAITVQPQVSKHPTQSGYMVYFGTGRYIAEGDDSNSDVQSFYGIWDDETGTEVLKSTLRQRKILADNVAITGTDFTARVTSALSDTVANGGGSVDWQGTEKGWYLDFDTLSGERVITDAIIRNKEIIFTTMIPITGDACSAGGEGLLMGLDLEQGTSPDSALFDVNGDGHFNDDKVVVNGDLSIISGINLNTGITARPMILDKDDGTSTAYLSGTQGNGSFNLRGNGVLGVGQRLSWRQLFN